MAKKYPDFYLSKKFTQKYILLLTNHRSTKPPQANTATHDFPPSKSIQSLPPYILPGISRFTQIFPYDILPPQTRMIYFSFSPRRIAEKDNLGNPSPFICRTYPSHLILSFIIALESGIEPHFSYSLLFEMLSVSRVPRTIRR